MKIGRDENGTLTVTVSEKANAEVVRSWSKVKPRLERLEAELGDDGPTGAQAIEGFILALEDNLNEDETELRGQIIRMAAVYSGWMAKNQDDDAREATTSGERSDATA